MLKAASLQAKRLGPSSLHGRYLRFNDLSRSSAIAVARSDWAVPHRWYTRDVFTDANAVPSTIRTAQSLRTDGLVRREDLGDLMAFAIIAEERSFTRAAIRLGLSSSALSHAIRLLEDRLGAKLLNRTTRSVAATAAGEALLDRLRPALAEIGAGLERLADESEMPRGVVRINSHRSAAMLHVLPKLPTLRARFPDVVLDLSTEEGLVDIVSGSYDAGIRHGERVAQDMVAVRIGPDYRTAVVASPSYIMGAPALHAPADLIRHSALAYRLPTSGALLRWEFSRNGHKFAIDVRPVFIANNNEAIVRAAVDGLGVAYLLREQVSDELKRGALVELLPDWSMSYEACYLYYPDRRQVRPAMRAVIDVLRYDG